MKIRKISSNKPLCQLNEPSLAWHFGQWSFPCKDSVESPIQVIGKVNIPLSQNVGLVTLSDHLESVHDGVSPEQ